jgi:hypothetical protein
MKKVTYALACALIVFFSLNIHAQERNNVAIDFRVGFTANEGYENPRAGLETSLHKMLTDRIGLTTSITVDSARKVPGGGHHKSVRSGLRFYKKNWFVGGGLLYGRQTTSLYSKAAASPYIEVGTIRKSITVRAFVEPYDFLSENHAIAGGFGIDYYAPTRKKVGWHLGFRSRVSHARCNQTAQGLVDVCTGVNGSLSFGLYWKLPKCSID